MALRICVCTNMLQYFHSVILPIIILLVILLRTKCCIACRRLVRLVLQTGVLGTVYAGGYQKLAPGEESIQLVMDSHLRRTVSVSTMSLYIRESRSTQQVLHLRTKSVRMWPPYQQFWAAHQESHASMIELEPAVRVTRSLY